MFSVHKRNRSLLGAWGILAAVSLLLVAARPASDFPPVIPLPDGFQPEGITIGADTTFYVGSIPTGAIFRGDLATGDGEIFIEGQEDRQAIGLKIDTRTNLLYVAGGATGMAFIYDAETGEDVAQVQLTDEETTFVNDVIVTPDAVYFTESTRPVFYRLALEAEGALPRSPAGEEVALTGDFVFIPDAFNANGIAASPHGSALLIVNSTRGTLYRVDSQTGVSTLVDLGGETLVNGDGLLLDGTTLYVVQNQDNQVAVVELDENWTTGTISRTITQSNMRVPTTIARFEKWLYAVNARFGTEPTSDTPYEVISFPMQ